VSTFYQWRVVILIRLPARTLYENRYHRAEEWSSDFEYPKPWKNSIALVGSFAREEDA